MIKALILKKALLTVEAGSIVNISESQFKALGGIAVAYKEEDKADEVSEAEAPTEESDTEEAPQELPEEPVEEKTPEKKSSAKKASSSKGKKK